MISAPAAVFDEPVWQEKSIAVASTTPVRMAPL
jgi:hypothetical protein